MEIAASLSDDNLGSASIPAEEREFRRQHESVLELRAMNSVVQNLAVLRAEGPAINSVIRVSMLAVLVVVGMAGLLAPSSKEAGPKRLDKCAVLSSAGGKYVLEQDVSSPGTCFSVQAGGITLDLNGHSVTYATAVGTAPAFGILGVACWDPNFGAKNPCGGSFDDFTVFGGTITQGEGAAPFSHGIRLGQGRGDGLTVHDVTFTVHAESSIPIYTTTVGTHAAAYNNTINNNVTVIQNRHQEQGQAIKFADSSELPGPAAIYGNHILGGAQGGILSVVRGSKIYENVVSQKATYTNDFGIYAWSDAGEVFNNTVTPILGRGIQIAGGSNGAQVHHNHVVVIEQRDNQEYEGCQIGGAFGIQFDDVPRNGTAFQNTVIAKADQCEAQALRVTDSRKGSGNRSHDNTYSAERVGNSTAMATGFGSGGATGFTSEHDSFTGDSSDVAFDWDGGQNLLFRECTFAKGKNAAPDYVTFSFRNGGDLSVSNIRFVDSVFENGAQKDSTDMKPILSYQDWPGPSEYFIDWTVTITVEDQQGKKVSGADIALTDAVGHLAYQGKTDQEGKISIALTELRVYNTRTEVVHERRTPYRVNVVKRGCALVSPKSEIEVTQRTSGTVEIACESK
jgi:hypothetical protein